VATFAIDEIHCWECGWTRKGLFEHFEAKAILQKHMKKHRFKIWWNKFKKVFGAW
jgi:hypothetical protein